MKHHDRKFWEKVQEIRKLEFVCRRFGAILQFSRGAEISQLADFFKNIDQKLNLGVCCADNNPMRSGVKAKVWANLNFISPGLIVLQLFLTGCFPDSFTKWDKPEEKVTATSGVNVTGPNGEVTNVPPPSGGTAPTSFSYGVTEVNLKLNQNMTSLTPTFVGQTGTTNTYIYTVHEGDDCPSTPVVTTMSSLGLALDSSTGVISGKPTVYPTVGSVYYSIRAYHVESGTYLCSGDAIEFNFGTDFSASGFKLFYPQPNGSKLILKVNSVTAFTKETVANFTPDLCTSSVTNSYCISNSSGAIGEIYHINTASNEIIIGSTGTGEIFSVGDSIDNSGTFVAEETKITDLTYSIDTDNGSLDGLFNSNSDARLVPDFSSTVSDEERTNLTWSISPAIDSVTNDSIEFATSGSDPFGGTMTAVAPPTFQSFEATTFTVTVANDIGQTKQATIKMSASKSPASLAYAQWKLITLDPDNSYFSPGDEISTNNGGSGIVKRLVGSDKILLESRGGDFEVDDKVDAVDPYLAERATVTAAEVVSSVLSMTNTTATGAPTGLVAGNFIGQALTGLASPHTESSDSVGIIKYVDTAVQILPLNVSLLTTPAAIKYREHVSPGTIVEGETTGAVAQVNYIDFDNNRLYVNVISGEFMTEEYLLVGGSKRLRLGDTMNAPGADYYDVYILTTSSIGFQDNKNATVYDVTAGSTSANTASPRGIINHLTSQNIRIYPLDSNTRDDNYMSTASSFPRKGFDIATRGGASGIITSAPTTPASYWDVLVESGAIRSATSSLGDGIDIYNPYRRISDLDTISKTVERLKFTVNRGQSINLVPQVTQGDNLLYSVTSGTLPLGLSLDSSTGIISGVPTDPTSASITVAATNAIGTVSFSFEIEVIDSFTLVDITDNADSYHLHRAGKGRQYSNCSVNSYQMNVTQYNEPKDITCYLEAGELDLYFNGLKLGVDVGPGLCDFVQMKPFSFYQYEYKKTSADERKVYYKYTKAASCTGNCTDHKNSNGTVACSTLIDDTVPTNPCEGNYTGSGGPNCDDGYYTIRTITLTDSASGSGNDNTHCLVGESEMTISDADTECNGSRASCIAGPIKDLLNDTQIDQFMNSKIYSSLSGADTGDLNWTFSSPISKGLITNRYIANSFTGHACYGTGTNGWDYDRVADLERLSSNTFYAVPMLTATQFRVGDYFSTNNNSFRGTVFDIDGDFAIVRAITGDDTLLVDGNLAGNNFGSTHVASATSYIETSNGIIHTVYPFPFANEELFYTVNCLDAAYDVKARIRLIVRDWNRSFNPSDGVDMARSTNYLIGVEDNINDFSVGDVFSTHIDSTDIANYEDLALYGGVVQERDDSELTLSVLNSSTSFIVDISSASSTWSSDYGNIITTNSGFSGTVVSPNNYYYQSSLIIQASTGYLRIGDTVTHVGQTGTILSFSKLNWEHVSVGNYIHDAPIMPATPTPPSTNITSISATDLMNLTSNDSFGASYNNRRDWDDGRNNIGNTKPQMLACPAGRGPLNSASSYDFEFPGAGL